MPVGHAARYGDDGHAEALAAVVQPQSAGEEAVAVGIVEFHAGQGAGTAQRAGYHFGEHVNIGAGVAHDGGFAGGAAAGVYAHEIGRRHGHETEGVLVAEMRFDGKGEAPDVINAFDGANVNAVGIPLAAVEWLVFVHIAHEADEAFALQGAELRHGHGFDGRLVNHGG